MTIAAVSCYDDNGVGYSSIDLEEKGAVVKVSNIVGGFFNLLDKENTAISADLSTIGEDVSNITIYKSYNGGSPVLVTSMSPGTFSTTLVDAVDGLNVTLDDVAVGDVFTYTFQVESPSGTYNSENSLKITASCPSDLAGEYSAETSGTSTDGCCPGVVTAMSDVTITGSNGDYVISDFSTGLYFTWYSVYGITEGMQTDGTLNASLKDVCGSITGTAAEPFGTEVTIEGSVDNDTGVITYTWVNGYNDTATVTLTPK